MGGPIFINIFNNTILSQNPSSSLVFNLCIKTSDWYLWVTTSVDYILYLMLAGLFGGRLCVQIHYDIYHSSDLEHEYVV